MTFLVAFGDEGVCKNVLAVKEDGRISGRTYLDGALCRPLDGMQAMVEPLSKGFIRFRAETAWFRAHGSAKPAVSTTSRRLTASSRRLVS